MEFYITDLLFDAHGKSETRLNANIEWLLGYFPSRHQYTKLSKTLSVTENATKIVLINEFNVKQIEIKFGYCDEALIGALATFSILLGGAE